MLLASFFESNQLSHWKQLMPLPSAAPWLRLESPKGGLYATVGADHRIVGPAGYLNNSKIAPYPRTKYITKAYWLSESVIIVFVINMKLGKLELTKTDYLIRKHLSEGVYDLMGYRYRRIFGNSIVKFFRIVKGHPVPVNDDSVSVKGAITYFKSILTMRNQQRA